jgi:hypothetical protein
MGERDNGRDGTDPRRTLKGRCTMADAAKYGATRDFSDSRVMGGGTGYTACGKCGNRVIIRADFQDSVVRAKAKYYHRPKSKHGGPDGCLPAGHTYVSPVSLSPKYGKTQKAFLSETDKRARARVQAQKLDKARRSVVATVPADKLQGVSSLAEVKRLVAETLEASPGAARAVIKGRKAKA